MQCLKLTLLVLNLTVGKLQTNTEQLERLLNKLFCHDATSQLVNYLIFFSGNAATGDQRVRREGPSDVLARRLRRSVQTSRNRLAFRKGNISILSHSEQFSTEANFHLVVLQFHIIFCYFF